MVIVVFSHLGKSWYGFSKLFGESERHGERAARAPQTAAASTAQELESNRGRAHTRQGPQPGAGKVSFHAVKQSGKAGGCRPQGGDPEQSLELPGSTARDGADAGTSNSSFHVRPSSSACSRGGAGGHRGVVVRSSDGSTARLRARPIATLRLNELLLVQVALVR